VRERNVTLTLQTHEPLSVALILIVYAGVRVIVYMILEKRLVLGATTPCRRPQGAREGANSNVPHLCCRRDPCRSVISSLSSSNVA